MNIVLFVWFWMRCVRVRAYIQNIFFTLFHSLIHCSSPASLSLFLFLLCAFTVSISLPLYLRTANTNNTNNILILARHIEERKKAYWRISIDINLPLGATECNACFSSFPHFVVVVVVVNSSFTVRCCCRAFVREWFTSCTCFIDSRYMCVSVCMLYVLMGFNDCSI